jgi:hypothetical protein
MAIRRYGRVVTAQLDDSDLHVDVMRFFAIVALCLFAVLPHAERTTPIHDPEQVHARHYDTKIVIGPNADIPTTTSAEVTLGQAQPEELAYTSTQAIGTQTQQALEAKNAAAHILLEQPPIASGQNSDVVLKHELARLEELLEPQPSSIPSSRSTSQQGGGIRFLNGEAFAGAVKNGSITLVYHVGGASFVFDTSRGSFTRVSDLSLQIFGLAASEIPEPLQHSAPKAHRVLKGTEQWFITLPEQTLANLLSARASERAAIVLNEWASPI